MSHPTIPPISNSKRLLFLSLAAVFFALAVVGAVLPILPTTPFLLVCSFLLVRSSPKLNQKLHQAPYFGSILRDWEIHGGVRTSVKLQAIATVVVGYSVSWWLTFGQLPIWGQLLVSSLVLFGIGYVARLPKPQEPSNLPIASEDQPTVVPPKFANPSRQDLAESQPN